MRFLLITQYYPPEVGAAPVRLQAMVRQLVERGHTVEVVTALPNYPTGRIFEGYRRKISMVEERDGAKVRRVWIHAATGSGVGRMLLFASFGVMSSIGALRSRRPDIVLVASPPLFAAVPGLLHRLIRRRARNVLLVADLWPDTAVELGLLKTGSAMHRAMGWLERRAYQTSWKVSPVTDGQIHTLTSEKDVPADRIAFLPNGVDTELFRPLAAGLPAANPRTVLFAGTLGYAQGLDVVLGAVARVRQSHPETRFLFVGGGSDKDRLIQRVESERISGVEFREPVPVDEVAGLYQEAFIGITSLRASKVLSGARPSKLFPIMASGRPVVYSGDGEGARLVDEARAGLVAPAGDAEQLALSIIKLLDDPALADDLGRNGRALVEKEFSWAVLIDRWLEELDLGN